MSYTPESKSQTLSSSPDYSAGMTAYIKGDYETAKQHWLLAAKENDAKAMFNLGLLHERQNVSDANQQRAQEWFQQAGNAGYAPADYHLALKLESLGDVLNAERLLQRAAGAGFVLAQERLGSKADMSTDSSAPNQPLLTSSHTSQRDNTNTTVNPVNTPKGPELDTEAVSSRAYNRESWLLNQPKENWTIQMLAFSDEAKVRNFIDDHGLHKNAAYFAQGKGGGVVYKLVYGSFVNKQQADQARAGFTAALKEHGPWLRPLKGVQMVISQR